VINFDKMLNRVKHLVALLHPAVKYLGTQCNKQFRGTGFLSQPLPKTKN